MKIADIYEIHNGISEIYLKNKGILEIVTALE